MKKLLLAFAVIAVPVASAAECRTYKAPPESHFSGLVFKLLENGQIVANAGNNQTYDYFHEEGLTQKPCDTGLCFGFDADDFASVKFDFHDDHSAVIWVQGDTGDGVHLWPAACDE